MGVGGCLWVLITAASSQLPHSNTQHHSVIIQVWWPLTKTPLHLVCRVRRSSIWSSPLLPTLHYMRHGAPRPIRVKCSLGTKWTSATSVLYPRELPCSSLQVCNYLLLNCLCEVFWMFICGTISLCSQKRKFWFSKTFYTFGSVHLLVWFVSTLVFYKQRNSCWLAVSAFSITHMGESDSSD